MWDKWTIYNSEKFLNVHQKIKIKYIMNPSCSRHTGLCCISWLDYNPGSEHTVYTICTEHVFTPQNTHECHSDSGLWCVMNCSVCTMHEKFPAFGKYNGVTMEQWIFSYCHSSAWKYQISISLVWTMSECLIFF